MDSKLWDIGATIFIISDWNIQDIIKTIEYWRTDPYHNPIMNRAWMLFLGFLL
jgi:hypothetical protein